MPKINLLYVITKLELGGAQKHLLDLITHLDKKRYNVFLFTACKGLLIPDALSIEGLTLKCSRFLERPINPLKDVLALIEIYRFIKRNKIDIVHTHSSKAGILGRLAARLAKTRLILHTVHGWSFNNHQSFFCRNFYICLERFCAQFTDKLIVVSRHDKQKGLENHIGDEDRYILIRYGINSLEFNLKDQNIRKELGIDTNDLVVGMVSCLKPQKSPQDFIRLANLTHQVLPNVKFLLVGDGILRKTIEKLIYKFNLKTEVILTGWRQDIPRILSIIDVFVLTSLWEGLPVAVLEAMAASLPVVATHTGGIAELVSEAKTGFLVKPRSITEMAEKISSLLRDGKSRKQIGQNARNSLSSDFSIPNIVKYTDNLYWDLLSNKKTTHVH
jgi:glycosyltransferase involved in cell wall biosynthesis